MAATILFAILAAAPASATGKVAPEITLKKLSGAEDDADCGFELVPDGAGNTPPIASEDGDEVTAPIGSYALTVRCPGPDGPVVPPPLKLKVEADRTAEPEIVVGVGALRVTAKRNDQLLPARVALYAAGSDPAGPPLATLKANQRQVVAAGAYDLLVVSDDQKAPRAEALLRFTVKATEKLQAVEVNLSDGGLVVQALADGKGAAATVRAYAPGSPRDLALVDAGQELRLPAGRYAITTELRDVADFATARRELWIKAQKTERIVERFTTGKLSVAVTQDGKPVDATVRLYKPGATDFFNHFSAPGTVLLSPGSYDVAIEAESAGALGSIRAGDVKVTKAGHVKKSFDLTPATLRAKVLKNGQPVFAELTVRAAGGGAAVERDPSGAWRLWPGRYEVTAKLEDGEELVDAPFEVKLGQKLERTLTLERATLTVFARRGKTTADDAEILVFKPGASKPTARARPGAVIELGAGVYDVKVVAGADSVWQQGIKVKRAQTLHVELPALGPDEALPDGDLTPPADELPEGDPAE